MKIEYVIIVCTLCLGAIFYVIHYFQNKEPKRCAKAHLSQILRCESMIDFLKTKAYTTETDFNFLKSYINRTCYNMYRNRDVEYLNQQEVERIEAMILLSVSGYRGNSENILFNPYELITILCPGDEIYGEDLDLEFSVIIKYIFLNYKRLFIHDELTLTYYIWLICSSNLLKGDASDFNCKRLEKNCHDIETWCKVYGIENWFLEKKIKECRDLIDSRPLKSFIYPENPIGIINLAH